MHIKVVTITLSSRSQVNITDSTDPKYIALSVVHWSCRYIISVVAIRACVPEKPAPKGRYIVANTRNLSNLFVYVIYIRF